jgi:hypothetical protein
MKSLLFALTFIFLPMLGAAGQTGVKFDDIPVGTEFHYLHDEGWSWALRYVGVRNGLHVIERRWTDPANDKVTAIYRYNPEGMLVQHEDWQVSPTRFVYTPYNCRLAQAGRCTHSYKIFKLADGKLRNTIRRDFEIRRRKDKVTVIMHPEGNRITEYFWYDDRNIVTRFAYKNKAEGGGYRLTKELRPR